MDETTLDLNFCIMAQPKSGSTWLVHLLSSIIDENYSFEDLEKYIPIKDQTRVPYRTHRSAPDPNLKNVRILRNPFDSLISWSNYEDLRAYSTKKTYDFSPYYKDIKSKSVFTIRYEDLNYYTSTTLRQVFKFLNWNVDQTTLDKIINKCRMDNLKEYEQKALNNDRKFLFYDPKAQLKDNKRFYNKGKCYHYKDILSDKEIRTIYNKYRGAINKYWPEILEQMKDKI